MGRRRVIDCVEAGRLVRIEMADDRVLVTLRPRGWSRTTTRKVDVVINCTGPLSDVAASRIPLIKGLVSSGHARPDGDGLGLDVDQDCRVRDAEGQGQDDLYAVGPMTRSAFWEITSVPDIRIQAVEVAGIIRQSTQ